MAGYIKLHRKLLESYQFSNPNNLKIWIWMLLKATHKKRVISVKVSKGYTDVTLERGQFLFGRKKAEIELGIDDSLIYRTLKSFQQFECIGVKSNNQYSIITICKYDDYNSEDLENEQPMNSGRTTDEQPMNTDKKDKKVKNVKEVFIAPSLEDVILYFEVNNYDKKVAEKAFNYYHVSGWKDSRGNQVKNWKQKMQSVWFKDENLNNNNIETQDSLTLSESDKKLLFGNSNRQPVQGL